MIFGSIFAGIHVRQLLWADWTKQIAHDIQSIKLGEMKWESPQMNAIYERWHHRGRE